MPQGSSVELENKADPSLSEGKYSINIMKEKSSIVCSFFLCVHFFVFLVLDASSQNVDPVEAQGDIVLDEGRILLSH